MESHMPAYHFWTTLSIMSFALCNGKTNKNCQVHSAYSHKLVQIHKTPQFKMHVNPVMLLHFQKEYDDLMDFFTTSKSKYTDCKESVFTHQKLSRTCHQLLIPEG